MYDKELVLEVLGQIRTASQRGIVRLQYRVIALNKSGEGEPLNTELAVL